jgi:glycosyltransferase involved in cell wall biosynthesis
MSILFLADYPNSSNIKDGMMQRIAAVDLFFAESKRTYLSVSILRNRKYTITKCNNNTIIKLNLLMHFLKLYRELRKNYQTVYIHSVYNCMPIYVYSKLCWWKKKKTNIILDVHGIVQEELFLANKKIQSWIYGMIEVWAFKNSRKVIFVTQKMKSFLLSKHRYFDGKSLVYSIYPKMTENISINKNLLQDIDLNKLIVIYSGNLQQWQNIELMLNTIRKNLSRRIQYIILTGDIKGFQQRLDKKGLTGWVKLLSLTPQELPNIYRIAHYGFILRDEIPVNLVANPTKLIEYLYFGMVPIVLCEKIGDFFEMGYEFVHINDYSPDIKKRKSETNKRIAKQIEISNKNSDILSFIRKEFK